ncbi:beta strand repeat-containing protein [Fibrella forsythiae]|uniref:Uncharacterized protein n=1 Tax=Fibrella forsythiae TaxID=2817061 RepID=A0ABS3JB69_9BACT|nr:hypothetical protein [Fibrella forsythiae]MBO0947232.1 hypothetical protein [Fibrella forsythiae]
MNTITRALLFLFLLPGLAMGQELTRSAPATSTGPINASQVTSGTFDVARFPNTVVTTNGAQNLLNKQLTDPIINGTPTGTGWALKLNISDTVGIFVRRVNGYRLFSTTEATKLANITGTNTGDQDLSNYVTLNGAQTLLSKTLTNPVINGGTISGVTSFGVAGNGTFTGALTVGNGTTGTLNLGDGSLVKSVGSGWVINGGISTNNIFSARSIALDNVSVSYTGSLGSKLSIPSYTGTDITTAQNGTAALASGHYFGQPTLSATNTGVTTTNATTVYIAGDPIAGTNQTITRSWGLYNAGKTYLGGDVTIPNRNTVFGSSTAAGTINFARGGDGATVGNIGYTTSTTEGAKLSVNAFGGSGSLSFGTGGVADRLTIASDGSMNATGAFTSSNTISGSTLQASVFQATGNTNIGGGTISSTGAQGRFVAYTNNDASTAASGTVATIVSHGLGIPTFTATNTGVTYTNLINQYIAGPPVPGTNVSAGNLWSLYVAAGNSYFNGIRLGGSDILSTTSGAGEMRISTNTTSQGLGFYFALTANKMGLFAPTTGNLILQNGGTYTDNTTDRLQVTGSIYSSANVNVAASDASGNGQFRIGGVAALYMYGTNNVSLGGALNRTLTGTANIGIGVGALTVTTTANSNIAMGTSAGQYLTSGGNNVFLGHAAGFNSSVTSASNNVLIGASAGRNQTGTISNVIALGNDVLNGAGNLNNVFTTSVPRWIINKITDDGVTNLQVNGSARVNTIATVVQTLTDAATTTLDANSGGNAIWTIGATGRTLAIANPVAGSFYTLKIIQDATGSRTITTWPANTKWPGGVVPTLTTTANGVDIVTFFYDGTNYNAILTNDFR